MKFTTVIPNIHLDSNVKGEKRYIAITEEAYKEYQFLLAEREELTRVSISNTSIDTRTGLDYATIGALRDKEHPLRLLHWRRSLNKSQAELAREVGISQTYYSSIENMKKRPSLELAVRLAKALDVPVKSLIADPHDKDGGVGSADG